MVNKDTSRPADSSDPFWDPKPPRTPSGEPRPTQIGRYRIIRLIGEGGMGSVYEAEQDEPVKRRVALKVIKPGMDSKSVIARFEAERQALAVMNHPGVAKVLDAGSTEQGRPYFVMEYVPGMPMTAYCDEHRLSIKERLVLFAHVCHAVQHAHQKGIIHRDIKPSNILVSQQDGDAVPRVIDFGLAKAMENRLTDKTLITEQGQLLGTPAYMSPEQAGMTDADIDTRTDIYSLGVLLYELLAGALPFEPTSLRGVNLAEIQRIIREEEPPKPSTRLSGLAETSDTLAANRCADTKSLVRQLQGDLDWIILKAMEKDRARRYGNASELADDIARHLNDEPVKASPPSAAYRLKKFARRNKGPVAAVLAVLAVLSAGVATATHLYKRAEGERQRAVAAEEQQALERELAEEARDDSDLVIEYLTEWLSSVDPEKQGIDVTLREMLDDAAKTIGDKFADKPLIEARLRLVIGGSYYALGRYEDAEPHDAAAAAIYQRELGPRHPHTLTTMNDLAAALMAQGKVVADGISFRKTWELQRRVLGEEHPDTLFTLNNLVNRLLDQSEWEEAESLSRRSVDIGIRTLGEEHDYTVDAMQNLAGTLAGQGKWNEAEQLSAKIAAIRERILGPRHPDTLFAMNRLAGTRNRQGKSKEAETLYRAVLEGQIQVLGEDHPITVSTMNDLAVSLKDQGRRPEAEQLLRTVVELNRGKRGENHSSTLGSMVNLASTLSGQAKWVEAEDLARQALERLRNRLGEDHSDTLMCMHVLAVILDRSAQWEKSEEMNRRTFGIRQRVLGEAHPDTLASMNNLAVTLQNRGRWVEVEALQASTVETTRRVLGDDHPNTLATMDNLGNTLNYQGKFTHAETVLRPTFETRRRLQGEQHPSTLRSANNLANALAGQGKYVEAESLFRQTMRMRLGTLGEHHPDSLISVTNVANVLSDQGKFESATELYNQALDGARVALEEDHPFLAYPMLGLAKVLLAQGDPRSAEPLANEAWTIRKELLATGHRDLADSQSVLGECLFRLGRFEQAEPLVLESYEKLNSILGDNNRMTISALSRIVELYQSWSATEPGHGYAEKAARFRRLLAEETSHTGRAPKEASAANSETRQ